MALKVSREAYAGFEAAVGAENVSESEAVVQIYAYNWGVELNNIQHGRGFSPFTNPPAAVILPSTTEQVQKVVRLCNHHGIMFKAISTGFGPWNTLSREGAVIMDLRRMNRIVKVDADNMFAVVEPYVTGAQLQAELMRHGLNCHMPGAGPQVSPLASSTSMAGPGFTSPSTGHSARNVLGVEWVLPSGEILRMGALGLRDTEKADWFTGDGPGPSLRGIMRGLMGALGGLGVFTRVAVKLYRYPCDTKWQIDGYAPDYAFEVPKHMQFHIVDYGTYGAMSEGLRRIEEEGVCFMCFHTSAYGLGAIFSHKIGEFIKSVPRTLGVKHPLVIMVAARTRREFEYKEMALASVIKETGGKDLTAAKRIVPKSLSYAEGLRSLLGFHGFIIGTSFQSTHGGMETPDMCSRIIQANIPLKKRYIERKALGPDKGEGAWSTSYEHGHFAHVEMPSMYDQTDERSARGMAEYMSECDKMDLKERFAMPFFIVGDEMHDLYGPQVSNYQMWLRRIKEALDPENISDPGFYISSKKGRGENSR